MKKRPNNTKIRLYNHNYFVQYEIYSIWSWQGERTLFSRIVVLAVVSAGCLDPNAKVPELVKTAQPYTFLGDEVLPESYDP